MPLSDKPQAASFFAPPSVDLLAALAGRGFAKLALAHAAGSLALDTDDFAGLASGFAGALSHGTYLVPTWAVVALGEQLASVPRAKLPKLFTTMTGIANEEGSSSTGEQALARSSSTWTLLAAPFPTYILRSSLSTVKVIFSHT